MKPNAPLAGVTVLDLTAVVMGPSATQMLVGMGADVIKVEPPEGDTMRHVGPMKTPGMGHIFLQANSGKRSVVLDLKTEAGRAALLALVAKVDVFVTNTRPAALARLGLSAQVLMQANARLVHVICCGYGQSGPYAAKPAYDDLIQGAVGIPWLMQAHGAPQPLYAPVTLADRVTGLHVAYAICAALFAREKTGHGQQVEVPMFEAVAQFVLGDHLAGLAYNPAIGAPGYPRLLSEHRRPYQTADGYLCVLIYNDKHWRAFFAATHNEHLLQDPRFATHTARAQNINEVYAWVSNIMSTRSTADWQHLLDEADIPNTPMNSIADLINDPHLQQVGFFQQAQHPTEGEINTVRAPVVFNNQASATPAPAAALGEHTEQVLRWAGCTDQLILSLGFGPDSGTKSGTNGAIKSGPDKGPDNGL
jgi:crotonobetainyl-CoA:carnitine CoA-transferase CaiB-like acyl-CoA transferase